MPRLEPACAKPEATPSPPGRRIPANHRARGRAIAVQKAPCGPEGRPGSREGAGTEGGRQRAENGPRGRQGDPWGYPLPTTAADPRAPSGFTHRPGKPAPRGTPGGHPLPSASGHPGGIGPYPPGPFHPGALESPAAPPGRLPGGHGDGDRAAGTRKAHPNRPPGKVRRTGGGGAPGGPQPV